MKPIISRLFAILFGLTLLVPTAFGQTGALMPDIYPVFVNANGITPVALGFVCTTASGGTTPLATYLEYSNTNANQNPIRLNAAGRAVNGSTLVPIFLKASQYRITVYAAGTGNTCNGVTVGAQIFQRDNVYDLASLLQAGTIGFANGTPCTVPSLRGSNFATTGLAWGSGPKLYECANGITVQTIQGTGTTMSGIVHVPGSALGTIKVGNQPGMLASPGSVIALANTTDIGWRNFADTANCSGITLETTNQLVIGSTDGCGNVVMLANGTSGYIVNINLAYPLATIGTQAVFRYQSRTNANAFFLSPSENGNVGAIGLGSSTNGNSFLISDPPAITVLANNSYYKNWFQTSNTVTLPAGTSPVNATVRIDEPNLVCIGTCTDAFSLYVPNAPTEGTRNAAAYFGAAVSLANNIPLRGRNSSNVDVSMVQVDGSDLVVLNGTGTNPVKYGFALIANGGGAAITLGTIGGSGPSTAGQNSWMKWVDTTGNVFYVPAWK